MEPDIKANADIANVRFIESINSLNTSLRAVIAKGDSWDYAQKQRFRGPLDEYASSILSCFPFSRAYLSVRRADVATFMPTELRTYI